MLIYHPAFDIYNCAFRLLILTSRMKLDVVEVERLRIWDFYLVFPGEVQHISFPSDLVSLKRIFKSDPNPYEDLIDSRRIFNRMKPYQIAAMRYLASYDLFDSNELLNNNIKRTSKEIPSDLASRMTDLTDQQENVIKLVTSPLNDLPLYGPHGFKSRTKLIEFKYDAI